jgi:hypothetical protein
MNSGESNPTEVTATQEPERTRPLWPARLLGICFAIFAFEIGIFLVTFPWIDYYWKINYLQTYPGLRDVWEDPYFRGALTGLGLVNIYVGFWELMRALRRPQKS